MPLTLNGTTGEIFPSWTTAGRPSTPTAGQTGYNTTLNTLEAYNGSAWAPIITTQSSANVTPTMLSQPFTAGTAVASTSGTSIDYTGIPSWVKRITVLFNAVGSTPNTSPLQVQIGAGSIDTSGYTSGGYYLISSANNGISSSSTGFLMYFNGAGALRNVCMRIQLVGSNVWISDHVGYVTYSTTPATIHGAGNKTLSGTLDRVRITSVSGTETFNAGSVNIFYE